MSAEGEGTLDVAFIGASEIHFGKKNLPWNHSAKLEKLPGLRFVAIVDPDTKRAEDILQQKLSSGQGHLYQECKIYSSIQDLLALDNKPHVVFVGIPPEFRGSPENGKDVELRVVSQGMHLFVEKPLSIVKPETFVTYSSKVEDARKKNCVLAAAGYMLRYHAGILKMKELMNEHGGKVMLCNGKYYSTYNLQHRPFWFDTRRSGGPIILQATHFYDLMRFLVGDVRLETVQAVTLRDSDPGGAGKLGHLHPDCDEGSIPPDDKIPRSHVTTWRFEAGGLGTLQHAVALHGVNFSTSMEVVMDGLKLTLQDPYTDKCKLYVRDGRTGSDEERVYDFGTADPFADELKSFIGAVKNSDPSKLLSTYDDATKTYLFTWAVRRATEAAIK